jgi:hypothetical protein
MTQILYTRYYRLQTLLQPSTKVHSENSDKGFISHALPDLRFTMTTRSLFDIIDSWTLFFDRATYEITLNAISDFFYKHKVTFLLLEDLWDLLEMMDDPQEFMTDDRMMILIEKLLRDEKRERIAKFVQLEISGPPEHKIEVLNADETISQFPSWFKEYNGMTWGDFKSSLFD